LVVAWLFQVASVRPLLYLIIISHRWNYLGEKLNGANPKGAKLNGVNPKAPKGVNPKAPKGVKLNGVKLNGVNPKGAKLNGVNPKVVMLEELFE
jgi:uncharacterized protein YjbI with pentapeptide repeats